MSVISWIILGLIAGFIGSKIVNKSGQGCFSTLLWALSEQSLAAFFLPLFSVEASQAHLIQ